MRTKVPVQLFQRYTGGDYDQDMRAVAQTRRPKLVARDGSCKTNWGVRRYDGADRRVFFAMSRRCHDS
jgi:hypothetical protein